MASKQRNSEQVCHLQVGQSFVKGLNDAMAPCVKALPQGASPTQCCSIVQGVRALGPLSVYNCNVHVGCDVALAWLTPLSAAYYVV